VAAKYLAPENLTIAIYGEPTEDDIASLHETYSVTILPKDDVFSGGFAEESKSAEAALIRAHP